MDNKTNTPSAGSEVERALATGTSDPAEGLIQIRTLASLLMSAGLSEHCELSDIFKASEMIRDLSDSIWEFFYGK